MKHFSFLTIISMSLLTILNFKLTTSFVLIRDAQLYYMQVSSWMVQMESSLAKGGSVVDDINKRCSLFIQVSSYHLLYFVWNTKFSQGLWRDNRDIVGSVENLIESHLSHFCLVQKQCYFVWNAKFSQKLWRDYRDNLGRVENFVKSYL